MKKYRIRIPLSDRTVHGQIWMPDSDGRRPAIIFSHGYNGSMNDHAQSAKFFAKQGFVAVTITFCGGGVKDPGRYPSTSMSPLSEKEDLIAVIRKVSSLNNVDPARLFLFGTSQGGLVSALTAAELKDAVRGLILLYPALCIEDDWAERYPNIDEIPDKIPFWGLTLGRKYAIDMHDFDTYSRITGYTGPVLIIHGTADAIVPCSYSEKAVSLYPNARLLTFDGEHHGFSPENRKRVEGAAFLFAQSLL